MKHYEITVLNGDHPLTYKCSRISEAYGCLDALRTGMMLDVIFDMDSIMGMLVDMQRGEKLGHSNARWGIRVSEGEV